MGAPSRIAGKIHKWLALLMAIQILFWFVSGLFFALAPIEWVRSEHMVAEQPVVSIPMSEAAAGLQRIQAAGGPAAEKVELRTMLGRPVALLSNAGSRPRLFDLSTGQPIGPITAPLAVQIAEADHSGPETAAGVSLVEEESPEYRGALPAWRVDFDDGSSRSLYVATDTGAVGARRSTLWRTFDFLWALHIMDFKDHENFNSLLLIIATALGLIVIVTGIILFPSRLGYNAWKRRRRAARAARSAAD